jgi:hypothetical protein
MSITIRLLCIIVREDRRLDYSASVEILKNLTDKFYNPCMQVEGKELSLAGGQGVSCLDSDTWMNLNRGN